MLVNQRPKSLFVENSTKVAGNQRDSAVNPKFLSRSNAFLKVKESEEFANSSRIRNRNLVVSVPSSNSSSNRSTKVGEQSAPSPNSSSNRSTKVGEQLLGSLAKKR